MCIEACLDKFIFEYNIVQSWCEACELVSMLPTTGVEFLSLPATPTNPICIHYGITICLSFQTSSDKLGVTMQVSYVLKEHREHEWMRMHGNRVVLVPVQGLAEFSIE